MSETPSQTAELSQEEVCHQHRVRVAKLASVHVFIFSRSLPQMRRRRLQRLGGLSLQSSPPSLSPSPTPGPASLPRIKTTSPEGRKAVSLINLQCIVHTSSVCIAFLSVKRGWKLSLHLYHYACSREVLGPHPPPSIQRFAPRPREAILENWHPPTPSPLPPHHHTLTLLS